MSRSSNGVLADEFIATYEDGSQGDKAKEISLTRDFNQQVDSAEQDEFRVKLYGDTAVVWFSLHLIGPRQGQPSRSICGMSTSSSGAPTGGNASRATAPR